MPVASEVPGMHWRAEFTDGRAPVMYDVRVRLGPGQLEIEDTERSLPLARWPLEQSWLDELQQGGVAHLGCRVQPDALLVLRDPSILGELRRHVGQTTRLPGANGWRRFAAIGLALLALLAGGLYLAIPTLSRAIAARVPLEYERELGAHVLPLLGAGYCDSPAATAALAELKRRLDPGAEVAAELHVMRSDTVNAFALPGGIVVINEELLRQATGPDEVAGVLAHELEHVRHRHVLTHFVRATLLSGAWSLAVGDYAGLMVIDPSTAFNIVNLRFSREEEAEADAAAGAQLDRAGISRRGLHDFFQRLRAETDGMPAWLSSHPSSESRANQLGAGSFHADPTKPALEPRAFDALREACQP